MRIRVILPPHLRKLAQVGAELELDVEAPITQRSVLDALEDVAKDRASRFKRASLHVLQAGHWPQSDVPDQVARAMLS